MQVSPQKPVRYRFGPFELDPAEGRLFRNGGRIKLQDLPFRLLVLLVERQGQIVAREEVRQRLWPENTFVEFDNSLGVAVRKLREALGDDADASRFVETLPRRGYRFLAPVTVLAGNEPAQPQVSGQAAGSHQSSVAKPVDAMTSQPSRARGGRSRIAVYWLVALLALFAISFVVYKFRTGRSGALSSPVIANPNPRVRMRRSVAVLGFRNLPGRPQEDWLSAAFSEMLNTELAAGGELRLVSGEDVARVKRELSLTAEDTLAQSTLEHLRTNSGADVVVLGSYTMLPVNGKNRIRLDIRLQDTSAGETMAEEAFTGNVDNLFELAAQAGVRIRESLGMSLSLASVTGVTRASLPANERAIRLYAAGRDKLWAFDLVQARDLLTLAVAADPQYPLAHLALSEAWWHLGYATKARAEAKRALDLSQQLSQEENLLIEGWYRQTTDEPAKAVEAYQSLFNLFPDRLDYGLRLATAQLRENAAAALRTLALLRNLPAPMRDDPRIDLTEASAFISQDLPKARAAAERAIAKASAQGSDLLVARSYGVLCQQGVGAGVSSLQVIGECERARRSYTAAGDKNNAARTTNDLAAIYYQQGELAKAEDMWRNAINEFRQVGDVQGLAASSNNLGDALLMQGHLAEAEKLLAQSIPGYQAIDDKGGIALALTDLGEAAMQRGSLDIAKKNYQRATAIASEFGDKSASAYGLAGLAEGLVQQDDLSAARKYFNEALELRKQLGEQQSLAETRIAMARLSIEEGHAADVEADIRQTQAQFHQELQADDELAAALVLSQALLAQSKPAAARKELDSAQPLADKTQNRIVHLQFTLQLSRALLASEHPEQARGQLEQLLKEANSYGLVTLKFETMLALTQLERKTGHAVAARTQVASLENSARAKGFLLIARKAAAER
jgi:DNA-binding winged helix-turn-helix (wHTH) protein/tetratricopeptide (TPR) repeat protein